MMLHHGINYKKPEEGVDDNMYNIGAFGTIYPSETPGVGRGQRFGATYLCRSKPDGMT
jgi:hypothetical protein